MSKVNSFEIILSGLIALFAIGFLAFLRWETGIGSLSSYEMNAIMAHADGVKDGTDVKIAGVTVGRITGVVLEPKTYRVKVQMEIRSGVRIPADSRLSVSGALMSSPYLTISPGRSKDSINPGGTLGAGA
jgi:phospholipid/cholesterol/gamma-HCH transport system substrate-binding protein